MNTVERLPRIAIIIPSLQTGGAELFVSRLIQHLQNQVSILLIVMKSFPNEISTSSLTKTKIYRIELNHSRNFSDFFQRIYRFIKEVKSFSPNAIQCFLYPAELLSLFLLRRYRIFWSVRGTCNPKESNMIKRIAMFFDIFISKFYPEKIVACSRAAAEWAIDKGAPRKKVLEINNFLDDWVGEVKSNSKLLSFRKNLIRNGIRIGMAARYDKLKGHAILIEAAIKFAESNRIPTTLSFIGRDVDKLIKDDEVHSKLLKSKHFFSLELIGDVKDDAKKSDWFSNLDLYVSASFHEGFPNSLAESISIGCPSISTYSGNADEMLDKSFLIQGYNAISISQSIENLITLPSNELKVLVESSRLNMSTLTNRQNIINEYLKTWIQ